MARQLSDLNNGPKIQKEKEIVTQMIELYCQKKHQHKKICKECQTVQIYAHRRLSLCRFGEEKSACSNCLIHCYKPKYRDRMKEIMRFAGPWMLLYHPVYSIRHLLNK